MLLEHETSLYGKQGFRETTFWAVQLQPDQDSIGVGVDVCDRSSFTTWGELGKPVRVVDEKAGR